MRVWRDPEAGKWGERWQRRGELLTVAGFTSAITTASTGHWVAALVAAAVTLLGIYVVAAAEAGWWLPGRGREREARERRFMRSGGEIFEEMDAKAFQRSVTSALDRIAAAVEAWRQEPPEPEE